MNVKPGSLIQLTKLMLSTARRPDRLYRQLPTNQPIMLVKFETDENGYSQFTFLVNEEVLQTHWITTKPEDLFENYVEVLS